MFPYSDYSRKLDQLYNIPCNSLIREYVRKLLVNLLPVHVKFTQLRIKCLFCM